MDQHPLPYGVGDLVSELRQRPNFKQVRCVVRGCEQWLQAPARTSPGEACPDHGIYVHRSSTYRYQDVERNIIVDPDVLKTRIVTRSDKVGNNRFGQENSEDAVSWNVFRSLMKAGRLKDFIASFIGEVHDTEPTLYLWGFKISDDSADVWPLLTEARQRFEASLPVDRPHTEPDISIHLPGEYLLHIEAKFTSPNTFYERGPRKDGKSLTFEELLTIYRDPSLKILDYLKAFEADRMAYQLWRNMIFAEYMAQLESPSTRAYHLNLVREGYEKETAAEFSRYLQPDYSDRFAQITWEDIYRWSQSWPAEFSRMQRYLQTKTAKLQRAFQLADSTSGGR